MSWDHIHEYEIGLDQGVYYPQDAPAEPWNGLISVDELPSDESAQSRYIDGVKTLLRRRPGEFAGRIEAYTYPSSLDSLIGSRGRKSFGFSYRITKPDGYLIHLVYNLKISPEGFFWDQSESTSFVWNFTTSPIPVPGARASAHLIIDTSKAYSTTVEDFENVIYGDESTHARLPLPDEVLEIFEENSILRVIDNGDGTWTAIGPDDVITFLDPTTFEITWPSAVYIDSDSYTIHSL